MKEEVCCMDVLCISVSINIRGLGHAALKL